MDLRYRRVILKVSGQSLRGHSDSSLELSVIDYIVQEIEKIIALGCEVGLVIGGGNFFRGKELAEYGITRVTGDSMGMTATVINALAIRDVCERHGIETRIMSALSIPGIVSGFDVRKALRHMRLGRMVVFAGGTGNPLVTTDSAASLRAIECEADALLKMTRVNGVFDKDPEKYLDARYFSRLNYNDVIEKGYQVMDMVAFYQCYEHGIPICVFDLNVPDALQKVVKGESVGTIITT